MKLFFVIFATLFVGIWGNVSNWTLKEKSFFFYDSIFSIYLSSHFWISQQIATTLKICNIENAQRALNISISISLPNPCYIRYTPDLEGIVNIFPEIFLYLYFLQDIKYPFISLYYLALLRYKSDIEGIFNILEKKKEM